jgi:hypothetical protein
MIFILKNIDDYHLKESDEKISRSVAIGLSNGLAAFSISQSVNGVIQLSLFF